LGILIVSMNISSSAAPVMSYCISPACPAPDKNSPNASFCMSCGTKILRKDRYRDTSSQMNAEDYLDRGVVKEDELNDLLGALADYNKAIEIDPEYMDAYFSRGLLKYSKLDDIDGAVADYNKAIDLDPSNTNFYHLRGMLKYEKLDDAAGALIDYNKSIELDPTHDNCYYWRGILKHNKLNDAAGALTDYNKSIKLNPNEPYHYNHRGMLKHSELHDITGAFVDYNKSIELDRNNGDFYSNRATLMCDLNNISGAIQDFRQSALLYQEQGKREDFANAIAQLKELGANVCSASFWIKK
jgi:tetratricopeptide (TPR) repeat protein